MPYCVNKLTNNRNRNI